MDAAQLHERITSSLLREIDEVDYPSVTMLNRVEAALTTRQDVAGYADVLVKKLEATRYPSIALLNRLDGMVARLNEVERREQEAQAQENDEGGSNGVADGRDTTD
jgi:hypothetical protein